MSSAEKYVPHYTVDDYRQWKGDWELWHGHAVSMSPSPTGGHGNVVGKLTTALNVAIDQAACSAHVLVEIDWIVSGDTVVRPGLSVVCGPIPVVHIEDTPAVAVEVLSKSTRDRDTGFKRALYQEQKVPWYLMADPDAGKLTVLKLGDDGTYAEVPATNPLPISICEDCHLQVSLDKLFT